MSPIQGRSEGGQVPARPAVLPVEPSARTYTLAALVGLLRDGHVRVPHFQRRLRWGTEDAIALVDSVLRGFPIGSLLLWQRPAPRETTKLGTVVIEAPEMDTALYVVDGQQRLTAFLNVFDPKAGKGGPFALVYDIKSRPFRVRARRSVEHDSIPLPTLFDLGAVLRWTRDNPQHLDLIDEIDQATTRLREFHVPAYEVRSEDDAALRDIYDRMNNSGKRLSRAEAFWGLHAPDEQAVASSTSFEDLQEHAAGALSWGRIDDDTILRLFLARRGYDVTRDIHPEFSSESRARIDFPEEDIETAHRKALAAMERAIAFLRDEAGVPHFTFLAYRYLLVVLTRFFGHFPDPSPRNIELLRRWYWRAALAGPAVSRGSATGAMRALALRITPGDESGSVQALMDLLREKPIYPPDPRMFRANDSATHVMLCALWSLAPRSPDTGQPFTHEELASAIGDDSTPNRVCLELVPRRLLSPGLRKDLGNRAIMPGIPTEALEMLRLSGSHFAGRGSDAMTGIDLAALFASHAIHIPTGGASGTDDQLVRERTAQLDQAVRQFLWRMTGDGLDDAPPLDDLVHDETDDGSEGPGDW